MMGTLLVRGAPPETANSRPNARTGAHTTSYEERPTYEDQLEKISTYSISRSRRQDAFIDADASALRSTVLIYRRQAQINHRLNN